MKFYALKREEPELRNNKTSFSCYSNFGWPIFSAEHGGHQALLENKTQSKLKVHADKDNEKYKKIT